MAKNKIGSVWKSQYRFANNHRILKVASQFPDLRSSYDIRTHVGPKYWSQVISLDLLNECLGIISLLSHDNRETCDLSNNIMNIIGSDESCGVNAYLSTFKIGTSSTDFKISTTRTDSKIVRWSDSSVTGALQARDNHTWASYLPRLMQVCRLAPSLWFT